MKYILLILLLIVSCSKDMSYQCVCYPKQNPENYTKYKIKNSYSESKEYCESLTNSKQYCKLTE